MGDGEVEDEVPPGRETREVDPVETEPVEKTEEIRDETFGTVCVGRFRDVRRRVSPVVPGDDPIAPGESADLGLPGPHVARELVTEDERHPLPGRLVVEIGPVYAFDRHRSP